MDWFLYDIGPRHERVKYLVHFTASNMRMLTALNQKIEELLKDGIRQNLFVELYM